ncbi:MAG: transposase [Bacteroidota bacterium]
MVKVVRRYSEAFKRSVVAEVESGRYTVLEAAAAHQVNFSSVYKWIKEMGSPDTHTRIMRIEMPNERKRIKQLEKEKRALESALAQAHMKITLLESTVEVLEEKGGLRLKKKIDTPSSNEPGAKDSA